MKNRTLFLFVIAGLAFFGCEKEENEGTKTGIETTTIIQGHIINQITEQPVKQRRVWLSELTGYGDSWANAFIYNTVETWTDVDGYFEFTYVSNFSESDEVHLVVTGRDLYDELKTIVNGEIDERFLGWGVELLKGKNYFFDIELTPK